MRDYTEGRLEEGFGFKDYCTIRDYMVIHSPTPRF